MEYDKEIEILKAKLEFLEKDSEFEKNIYQELIKNQKLTVETQRKSKNRLWILTCILITFVAILVGYSMMRTAKMDQYREDSITKSELIDIIKNYSNYKTE